MRESRDGDWAAAANGGQDLPLGGIRVVEAGRFASGPSCATVLADWGADVIKLEPPGGDPARAASAIDSVNPRFELHNRSRRSISVDLTNINGQDVAHRLLKQADVFVTNMRPRALDRLRLSPVELLKNMPRLVYGQISGYGVKSSRSEDPSYDHGAFWAYTGMADLFTGPDGTPPQPAGGMGDRSTGAMLAGGIAAALLRRERTGDGGLVTISLLATGIWMLGSEYSDALQNQPLLRSGERRSSSLPTLNCFEASDGRWIWLQMMEPERHWDRLLEALEAPWIDEDPRFARGKRGRLAKFSAALVELLDEMFRRRPSAEWEARLRSRGVPVAVVQAFEETANDPIALESGAVIEGAAGGTGANRYVNSPCVFDGAGTVPAGPAPTVGQHTFSVLQELGYTPSEIRQLEDNGIVEADRVGR